MNRKIFGALFLLVLFSFVMLSAAYAISWRYNLEDALKTAKQKQMPIMIDFYTDWCGWCKKLDQETYSNSEVKKLAEQFISVKIDGDRYPELISKYGVSGYPTIVFLSYEGGVDGTVVGFREAANFVTIMNGILERTKKPAAKKPAETKKPAEAAKKPVVKKPEEPKPVQKAPPKPVDPTEFVYNGYLQGHDGGIIAQVNHKGQTHFVKKGDSFNGYEVIELDTEKLILKSTKGQLVLEFKKPIKAP